MAGQNVFRVEVEALDASQGYLVRGLMIVDGASSEINEHYGLESQVRTRLGTGFDVWAAQVNSE